MLFALILCGAIVLARQRIKKLVKLRQSKPSSKYLTSRLRAKKYFDENFIEILYLARRINKQDSCSATTYRISEDEAAAFQAIEEKMSTIKETYEAILQKKLYTMYGYFVIKSEDPKIKKSAPTPKHSNAQTTMKRNQSLLQEQRLMKKAIYFESLIHKF